MYQRTLSQSIASINRTFPVLLLTGPRQVGKTTLLEMCREANRRYVTLDNLEVRAMAQNDPGLFMQSYPPPVMIDEIQYAPNLFSFIKIVVDREKKNGLYWLTGSQKYHLMDGISESLAGRVAIIELLGLSQSELLQRPNNLTPFLPTIDWIMQARKEEKKWGLKEVYQQIYWGAFPAMHVGSEAPDRDIFYSSYVQTYIQRDVKDYLKIANETTFYYFLVAVAARTGQALNYADLSRDVQIDHKTAKSWLSLLEKSGLVYLLPPYHNNITKRLVTSMPKLYFLDTGLCAYLTKWPSAEAIEVGNMAGAFLETYCIAEIIKSYLHNGKRVHAYYYRDKDQNEVDLVIDVGDTLYPVECKKTGTPSRTAPKQFDMLKKSGKNIGHGAVLCFVEEDVPLSREVSAVPVGYL